MLRARVSGLSWICGVVLVCGATLVGRAAEPFPGTQPLAMEQPLDVVMVDGIDQFALRELAASIDRRAAKWKHDFSSTEAYEKSVAANRERFRTIIGAVDPRVENSEFEILATTAHTGEAGGLADKYRVWHVRWRVLENVTAEGLLINPLADPRARIIALPDADWTPEQFAGLTDDKLPASGLVRELAAQGCQVVIPMLISRDDTLSGSPLVTYTNQPHREFIYRQAFELGRHVIGYEVQKVLAAVDIFTQLNAGGKDLPIGVTGVGEGGLLALYAGAVDPRIDVTSVHGYFQRRENVWQEPIYRNVWSLLTEFGDAEIASLIAPRGLIIEACGVPEIAGPPALKQGRRGGAAPGKIEICTLGSVRAEHDRAVPYFEKLKAREQLFLVASREGDAPPGSQLAIEGILKRLGLIPTMFTPEVFPAKGAASTSPLHDPAARQKRQFDELVAFTQLLLKRSAKVRDKFWAKADRKSLETWDKSSEFYRDYVYDELIGRLPAPTIEPNVRTRQVLDEPGYTAYEVVIDVYPDVIAGGILLMPKDIKPGEKRPVVVCQHGLEGVPMDTISKTVQGFQYYSAFSHELANRGFITYAPQNPYRGQDRFRTLQRKSNPLHRSLFSYIIPQHERTIDWLASLPQVDANRIAFYGLSYGGKTAVRVPPLVKKYCLSICSADFDEWVLKISTTEDHYSYVFTGEYEIFEWNMGHVANYAELSSLMTPRPFMVERGHNDGVAPDEWVAWEYAKVRRHYTYLGLTDKTEIEFFNGPHKINGVQTYEFLHKHLNWPKK